MRGLVERLQKRKEKPVFLNYVEAQDAIRASFAPSNTIEEIQEAVAIMKVEIHAMQEESLVLAN
jgi:selenocysteine lyase/cysteine desulfurase